ncbi:phosphohistidine phosphatase SixA [Anaerobiospirillum sp. NML120449]|uniref:phosphohistidine phosphatase SixA n=1 Tax=Anaerobiospirillum sp. NML120449 TaxID=2932817 RepID=UPI001FF1863F|nr:phosphohistidine phosphatase SixA [Anaerobiospirillum sp. NML120449]MCK0527345.1 phosphohistidine phosphatase SixA [Anaerobiospirillum sp. NML120449]
MKIIVMRHGDAMFSGGDRILSPRGEQEARLTGMKLASVLNISRIISSPKQRAVRTAEVVRSLLRGRNIPEIEILPELSPEGDTRAVVDFLEATAGKDDNVLLVSHIPQVVNLSYAFCNRDQDFPAFYTAAALVLSRDEGSERFHACNFYQPAGEGEIQDHL